MGSDTKVIELWGTCEEELRQAVYPLLPSGPAWICRVAELENAKPG